jgi:succinoglycan biosynthesis protein ExoA
MYKVSVIVPCYNEQARIEQLLNAIYEQSYPFNEIEVIIADGMSTDQTRTVINRFQDNHPKLLVRIIDNLKRAIPSGLNRNCVLALESGKGDNVGGIWRIQAGTSSWIAKSIAITASHPLAVGDAHYRIGGVAQEVDTVPFGAFRRELIEKIGMFDETLLTNEDYEFNVRVRKSGGKVWMDPSIHSIYFARSTLLELSEQYWRYGYWKAQMLRRYPETVRWRQALPPLFVLSLLCLGLLSIVWFLARWLFTIIVILYTIIICMAGIHSSIKHRDLSLVIGIPLATATIHLSWGLAFLWGIVLKPGKTESQ